MVMVSPSEHAQGPGLDGACPGPASLRLWPLPQAQGQGRFALLLPVGLHCAILPVYCCRCFGLAMENDKEDKDKDKYKDKDKDQEQNKDEEEKKGEDKYKDESEDEEKEKNKVQHMEKAKAKVKDKNDHSHQQSLYPERASHTTRVVLPLEWVQLRSPLSSPPQQPTLPFLLPSVQVSPPQGELSLFHPFKPKNSLVGPKRAREAEEGQGHALMQPSALGHPMLLPGPALKRPRPAEQDSHRSFQQDYTDEVLHSFPHVLTAPKLDRGMSRMQGAQEEDSNKNEEETDTESVGDTDCISSCTDVRPIKLPRARLAEKRGHKKHAEMSDGHAARSTPSRDEEQYSTPGWVKAALAQLEKLSASR